MLEEVRAGSQSRPTLVKDPTNAAHAGPFPSGRTEGASATAEGGGTKALRSVPRSVQHCIERRGPPSGRDADLVRSNALLCRRPRRFISRLLSQPESLTLSTVWLDF
jgi:hypothetical protein